MGKIFVGYCVLGASNRQEAEEQKGLQVWMTEKPGVFKRFILKTLLGILWVDRVRELEHVGIKERPQHNTSFNKYAQRKSERKNEYKRGNSEQSDRS
jgi:hypothetical protein